MGEDPDLSAWITNLYEEEVEYTDHELQRLWQALAANGQLDDTIVFIVSDHTEGLGEHGQIEHGAVLYEESLNVAIIMHVPMPGFEPRRIAYPARTVDMLPTVLELLNFASGSTELQGESLVDVLRGATRTPPPSFARGDAWGIDQHSILDKEWRLIADNKTEERELYNLTEDPDESVNLPESHPKIAQRMGKAFSKLRALGAKLRLRSGAGQDLAVVDPATQRELQGLSYGDGHDATPGD
ncbi:MAG: choline-sulfatase [Candidatus Paceibacteria bacterium]|jgi:choline-sulfatase